MKVGNDAISVLSDDIEEEVLKLMPEWFRRLRDGYRKRTNKL